MKETKQINNEYGYIYKIGFYESKKHRISHTDLYYENPEHCHEFLDCPLRNAHDIIKIEYIRVKKDTSQYQSAIQNSKIRNKQI